MAGCVLTAMAVNHYAWTILDDSAREFAKMNPVVGEAVRRTNDWASGFFTMNLILWAGLSAPIMEHLSLKWKREDAVLWPWLAVVPTISAAVHSAALLIWHLRVTGIAASWSSQTQTKFESGAQIYTDHVNLVEELVIWFCFGTPLVAVMAAFICWFGYQKGVDAQIQSNPTAPT